MIDTGVVCKGTFNGKDVLGLRFRPADIQRDAHDIAEVGRASTLLRAVRATGFDRVVIVHPNNDPGSTGIRQRWDAIAAGDPEIAVFRDLPRRRPEWPARGAPWPASAESA